MSVIAAYYYNEGRRIREVAIDERVELDKNRSGFCWIGLSEPSVNELRALQTTYNLHPLGTLCTNPCTMWLSKPEAQTISA